MREKIELIRMDYFEAIKRNQARNKDRFAVGTVFRGDINGALMEIVKLQPNYSKTRTIAVIKDLKTGKLHNHGLSNLECCHLTIISTPMSNFDQNTQHETGN